jgi:hypothetical protein
MIYTQSVCIGVVGMMIDDEYEEERRRSKKSR